MLGASVVWHISLPLINSFNKPEAAIYPMKAVLPEVFLFSQLNYKYLQCIQLVTLFLLFTQLFEFLFVLLVNKNPYLLLYNSLTLQCCVVLSLS